MSASNPMVVLARSSDMACSSLSVDEIVATLQHSSLPTVLIEGSDDALVYRWLEGSLEGVDFLPCGGRENLFQVFDRRHEFPDLKVAFVADRDMWVFSTIPREYDEVIFTTGYSIENDLYYGSSVEDLLDTAETADFAAVLRLICEWFAFEVEEYRAGRAPHVDRHPNEVVHIGTHELAPGFVAARGYTPASAATVALVYDAYKLHLRGKILVQLLVRYLSASGRSSKYGRKEVLEVCCKLARDRTLIDRLQQEVEKAVR